MNNKKCVGNILLLGGLRGAHFITYIDVTLFFILYQIYFEKKTLKTMVEKRRFIQKRLLAFSKVKLEYYREKKANRYQSDENKRFITSPTATVQLSYQFINLVTKERQAQASLRDSMLASSDYLVLFFFLSIHRSFLLFAYLRFHFCSKDHKATEISFKKRELNCANIGVCHRTQGQ